MGNAPSLKTQNAASFSRSTGSLGSRGTFRSQRSASTVSIMGSGGQINTFDKTAPLPPVPHGDSRASSIVDTRSLTSSHRGSRHQLFWDTEDGADTISTQLTLDRASALFQASGDPDASMNTDTLQSAKSNTSRSSRTSTSTSVLLKRRAAPSSRRSTLVKAEKKEVVLLKPRGPPTLPRQPVYPRGYLDPVAPPPLTAPPQSSLPERRSITGSLSRASQLSIGKESTGVQTDTEPRLIQPVMLPFVVGSQPPADEEDTHILPAIRAEDLFRDTVDDPYSESPPALRPLDSDIELRSVPGTMKSTTTGTLKSTASGTLKTNTLSHVSDDDEEDMVARRDSIDAAPSQHSSVRQAREQGSYKGSVRDSLQGSVKGSKFSEAGSQQGSVRQRIFALQQGSYSQAERRQSSVAESVRDSVAGSVRGSTAGSVRENTAGSVRGSTASSVRGSTAGSVRGSTAGSVRGSTAGSVRGSTAGSVKGSSAGSERGSVRGSVTGIERVSSSGSIRGGGIIIAAVEGSNKESESVKGTIRSITVSQGGSVRASILAFEEHSTHAEQTGSVREMTRNIFGYSQSGSIRSKRDSLQGSVRGSERGSVRGSERGSVRGSERGSVRVSERGSVRGSEQGSVRVSERGSVHGSERGSVRGSERGSVRGSERGSMRLLNTGGGAVVLTPVEEQRNIQQLADDYDYQVPMNGAPVEQQGLDSGSEVIRPFDEISERDVPMTGVPDSEIDSSETTTIIDETTHGHLLNDDFAL